MADDLQGNARAFLLNAMCTSIIRYKTHCKCLFLATDSQSGTLHCSAFAWVRKYRTVYVTAVKNEADKLWFNISLYWNKKTLRSAVFKQRRLSFMMFRSAFAVYACLNARNSLCKTPIISIRFQINVKWEDIFQYQIFWSLIQRLWSCYIRTEVWDGQTDGVILIGSPRGFERA